jgi:hypothetical protein
MPRQFWTRRLHRLRVPPVLVLLILAFVLQPCLFGQTTITLRLADWADLELFVIILIATGIQFRVIGKGAEYV